MQAPSFVMFLWPLTSVTLTQSVKHENNLCLTITPLSALIIITHRSIVSVISIVFLISDLEPRLQQQQRYRAPRTVKTVTLFLFFWLFILSLCVRYESEWVIREKDGSFKSQSSRKTWAHLFNLFSIYLFFLDYYLII